MSYVGFELEGYVYRIMNFFYKLMEKRTKRVHIHEKPLFDHQSLHLLIGVRLNSKKETHGSSGKG
jgi:hypothetical protein